MTRATIGINDVEVEVGLRLVRFPNGGSWSFFAAPCCGRRCRTLRLLDGAVLCRDCHRKRGVYPRAWAAGLRQRAQLRIPKLKAKLESPVPLRLKPHLRYSKMERRTRFEAALRKAELLVGNADFVKRDESDGSAGEGS
jgi:hypothetical protein